MSFKHATRRFSIGIGYLLIAAILGACDDSRVLREGGVSGLDDGIGYTVVGHIPRLQVLFACNKGLIYGIEDHFLYVSEDGGDTFLRRGVLPNVQTTTFRSIRSAIARLDPVRKIRKNPGPNSLVVLRSGTILVFFDQIYRSTDGGHTFEVAFNPSTVGFVGTGFDFGVGVAVGPDDEVFIGEYKVGSRPQAVHVLRGSDDGTRWEVAYRFEPGETFHVHSITYDPYREVFWLAVGDLDSETGLFYTSDGFDTLLRLGGGSQNWRIVQPIVTRDYLYWGSDNDTEEGAAILRWSFADAALEELQYLGKVSYYATQLANGTLIIGTTLEPNSLFFQANSPPTTTDLWISRNGDHWRRLLELPYEPMETPYGPARAQVGFPGGRPLDRLFMVPRFTQGNPFVTLVLQLEG